MNSFWQNGNLRGLLFAAVFGFALLPTFVAAQTSVNDSPVKQNSGFVFVPNDLQLEDCPPVPLTLQKQIEAHRTYYYLSPVLSVTAAPNRVPIVTTKEISNPTRLLAYRAGESAQAAPAVQTLIPASDWIYDLYPSPDRSLYLYNADDAGDGQYQFYLYNPNTKQTVKLTANGRNVEPVWSPDGKQIAFGSAAEKQEGMSLVISNVSANAKRNVDKRLIAQTQFMLTAQDWSSDNCFLAYIEYFSNRNSAALWLVDLATNKRTIVSPVDFKADSATKIPDGEATAAQFSADNKKLYFAANHAGEFIRLYSYDLATKQIKAIGGGKNQDIEAFRVSPRANQIAVVYNDSGASRLFLMNADGRDEKEIKLPAAGTIENLVWSADGNVIAFNFASAGLPAAVFYVDAETRSNQPAQLVASSPAAGEKHSSLPNAAAISWQGEDGLTLNGWLYKPAQSRDAAKNNRKSPVIIDIHGGPEDAARPVYEMGDAYYLNSAGAVVIYPNVRGSTGRGKSFLNADNALKRTEAVKDFGKLFEWIARQPDLDSKRIMLRGFSYGGYMALLVAATFPDKVAAVTVESAPSNLVTLLKTTSGWRRAQRRNEYGDERNHATRAGLEKIAPRNFSQNLRMPLFLAHGARDPRVPASESKHFVADVRARGNKNVWFLLAADDGHGLTGENDNYRSLLAALFFEKFVAGDETANSHITQNKIKDKEK